LSKPLSIGDAGYVFLGFFIVHRILSDDAMIVETQPELLKAGAAYAAYIVRGVPTGPFVTGSSLTEHYESKNTKLPRVYVVSAKESARMNDGSERLMFVLMANSEADYNNVVTAYLDSLALKRAQAEHSNPPQPAKNK
jgi:hypothetical protein